RAAVAAIAMHAALIQDAMALPVAVISVGASLSQVWSAPVQCHAITRSLPNREPFLPHCIVIAAAVCARRELSFEAHRFHLVIAGAVRSHAKREKCPEWPDPVATW